MKVLFLAEGGTTRRLSPASMFRVYQYLEYLEKEGIECTVFPSFPEKYFIAGAFWARPATRLLRRLALLAGTMVMACKRFIDIACAGCYDVVVIQRELLPVHLPPFLETLLRHVNGNIIFDFDDAIYTRHSALGQGHGVLMRALRKLFLDDEAVPKMICLSKHVIAGNDYLRRYALQYNPRVSVIPTPVDASVYKPTHRVRRDASLVIGWIGTNANLPYLRPLEKVFTILAERYDFELRVVAGLGQERLDFSGFKFSFQEWKHEEELNELSRFDIGLMPLPDDEWTRGKCSFKALVYMAMGIPTVASPVGMNTEIIQDGVNGFLAGEEEEWLDKLALLLEDEKLRTQLGAAGRDTVEERYSVQAVLPQLIRVLRMVGGER